MTYVALLVLDSVSLPYPVSFFATGEIDQGKEQSSDRVVDTLHAGVWLARVKPVADNEQIAMLGRMVVQMADN